MLIAGAHSPSQVVLGQIEDNLICSVAIVYALYSECVGFREILVRWT